ncbi:MAG: O-antigen ligase family protein [bacterium]
MRERRYFIGCLAFLFAFPPFFPQMSYPGTAFLYASVIPLLFLLLCLDRCVTLQKVSALPLFLPLCAILLVSVIYTFHSIYPYQSQHKLLRLLIGTLLYLTVALIAGERRKRVVLGWAILCGGTLLAADALSQQAAGYQGLLETLRREKLYDSIMQQELIKTLEAGRALGRFGNPNHLAGYLILALWTGVLLWPDCRQRWQRLVLLGVGLVQVLCVYRTYSRSGLLALALSLGILGLWMLGRVNPSLRRRLLLAGGLACLVLLAGLLFFAGNALGGRLLVTSTIQARIHFFRHALLLIADHLPGGTGLESFQYLATQHIRPGELESLYPHNIFLGTAVESGFVGLFALLWFSLVGLRWWGRSPDIRTVVGFGAFAAFLFLSCIDFHNEIAEILFMFLALQGLCDARSFSAKPAGAISRLRLVVGVLIGVCLWWILVFCPYMAATYRERGLEAATVDRQTVLLFEKAAFWAPRDAQIANNLGNVLCDIPSPDARKMGLEFLRRAVELNPAQAYFHGDLAEAMFEDNRAAEALAENDIACRLFPKKVLYIRRKAKYSQALGQREEWERWTEIANQMEKQDRELRP